MASGETFVVNALKLGEFKRGAGPIFGKLGFLSGLVLATKGGEMGAVSSIRLTDGGTNFISVMDTGHWATGSIERDKDGKLAGVKDYRIFDMRDPGGNVGDHKENTDAEGMVLAKDRVYVSFERIHRIAAYPYPGFESSMPLDVQEPILARGEALRPNGGIEALLKAPDDGPLAGALVFVAERSYDSKGNFIAGVQSGPRKGTFYVERLAPYDVTDGVFLDDGSFLLLERKFGLRDGIGMRIRRFSQADIAPGATIKGETLMEADFSHQIDNMEGIDAYKAADGSTRLIVISDDNHSLLERNLMLEFKLLP
ncbi:esterase-like activity of phytase family protein [Rhizobium sp. KVB221]|uniref:Esterase-like activity of phytase family protein n=2 Tax=Rhizobium setariae TaxID=2801340 RepID=A0A936YML3_9HYPH|nr:esterase-like activity of phytase family protein [Rhizobium setariae]MBL0371507.1 esterase-like activity of phytase family protein [Rhizobium setariae]